MCQVREPPDSLRHFTLPSQLGFLGFLCFTVSLGQAEGGLAGGCKLSGKAFPFHSGLL